MSRFLTVGFQVSKGRWYGLGTWREVGEMLCHDFLGESG